MTTSPSLLLSMLAEKTKAMYTGQGEMLKQRPSEREDTKNTKKHAPNDLIKMVTTSMIN